MEPKYPRFVFFHQSSYRFVSLTTQSLCVSHLRNCSKSNRDASKIPGQISHSPPGCRRNLIRNKDKNLSEEVYIIGVCVPNQVLLLFSSHRTIDPTVLFSFFQGQDDGILIHECWRISHNIFQSNR